MKLIVVMFIVTHKSGWEEKIIEFGIKTYLDIQYIFECVF